MVGWQVGATMPEELATLALQRAFWSQSPTLGLFVHSYCGGQYFGNAYRQLLHDHQAMRSLSRCGDCYDNAQAVILWSRLKTEVLELREQPVFSDLTDAQASVTDYLTTTTTSGSTQTLTTRHPIILINSFFNLTS